MAQPDYTQRLERLLEISRKLTSNLDLTPNGVKQAIMV
jgi:hypothetical protein